jgi:hypothetical protein
MAAKKKVDPIKQREKRAKIAAIAGVVLLLGVAALEGPKMMKLMNQKPVVPPPSAAAPVGSSALPGTGGAPTTTTPAGELADTDVPPAALDGGQLVSFDVFQTKDPFRPQVTSADVAAADAAAAAADSGATATQSAPATGSDAASSTTATTPSIEVQPTTTTPATAVPSTPSAPSGAETTTTPAKPSAPTVSISVNGTTSHVARGGAFPSSTPVFRLVSWTKGAARIGIVGGSYSTGDPTLELTLDNPVTLQNTSNGQRYKLVLLSTP